MTDRLTALKTILWTIVGVLAAVTAVRFAYGLGSVTNLSDAAPWGLWIGFDVMSGVALAAGGFVLAATVYIFGLERYRPFVRPAVLTALLGYAAVAVGLLYDLGLPWRIWHPLVHWQHRSVLFEVAMCVMLYLTVLALEFAPAVLEHPLFSGRLSRAVLRVLKKATIPLVITGIVLSTLHQSSLGSLFLITPYRLHPLWYSHIIYLLFFVSAVGLGLMMVVLESLLSAWFLGHQAHRRELAGLGVAASVVLWIYVALRVGDLALRGVLGLAVTGSREGNLFLFEIGMSAVLPATLLLFERVRSSLGGLAVCAALTVSGMVLYRLDVSILSFARPEGFGYFPSWEEFAVSLGIVSAAVLIFIFFVEHLKVYDDVGGTAEPVLRPSYDPATLHRLMPRVLAAPRRYSAAALGGVAVALVFLPMGRVASVPTPTSAATSVRGEVLAADEGGRRTLLFARNSEGAEPGDPAPEAGDPKPELLLLIDGDRNGDAVLFDHDDHIARLGADSSCMTCHHLNLPLDRTTGCWACHRDMFDTTSLFDHREHEEALGGNAGCSECHGPEVRVKTWETATACMDCHADAVGRSSVISPPHDRWSAAVSYTDAMHGLCVKCHEDEIVRSPERYAPSLADCGNCHDPDRRAYLRALEPTRSGIDRKGTED